MIIRRRKEIINALEKVDKSYKGNTMGSSYIKRFCQEGIENLDEKMKYKNCRENIESLTGIKVRKFGNVIF